MVDDHVAYKCIDLEHTLYVRSSCLSVVGAASPTMKRMTGGMQHWKRWPYCEVHRGKPVGIQHHFGVEVPGVESKRNVPMKQARIFFGSHLAHLCKSGDFFLARDACCKLTRSQDKLTRSQDDLTSRLIFAYFLTPQLAHGELLSSSTRTNRQSHMSHSAPPLQGICNTG